MHLSLKQFSSAGPAPTCQRTTESLCSRAPAAGACGQKLQTQVSPVEMLLVWITSPGLNLFSHSVFPKAGPVRLLWRLARIL